jgi:hypothetical protein
MLDQPSNALRLAEAGCAAQSLPFAEITAQVGGAGCGGKGGAGLAYGRVWSPLQGLTDGWGPAPRASVSRNPACRRRCCKVLANAHIQRCLRTLLLLQALASRITSVLGDATMRERAKLVAAEVGSDEWRGAAAAAEAVLAARSPWAKLKAARVIM